MDLLSVSCHRPTINSGPKAPAQPAESSALSQCGPTQGKIPKTKSEGQSGALTDQDRLWGQLPAVGGRPDHAGSKREHHFGPRVSGRGAAVGLQVGGPCHRDKAHLVVAKLTQDPRERRV